MPKGPTGHRRRWQLAGLAAVSGVALLLDTTVPDGFSGNILYVLPIICAVPLGLGSPYLWAAIGSVLSVMSSLMAPPGLPLAWEAADRAVTIAVLWATAWLVRQVVRRTAEARAAQRTAESAQRAAEAADRRKARFLAAASHDLRQPAQSLTLFAEVLKLKTRGTELEKVVAPLESAVEGLNGMLGSLLELSRLDAGLERPRPQPIVPTELLTRLEASYALLAAQRGMRFRMRTFGLATPVTTDPEFLERILRNLLDNAFKYTEGGFVSLRCSRAGDALRLSVCDSGCGIDPEYQEAVFEEFFQLGNEERDRSKGLGIGLTLVQRSVALLGGRIRVWSRPGRGTRFTVELPA